MKVGIVIMSHQALGLDLLKATESIVKQSTLFASVGVAPEDSLEFTGEKILQAVSKVDQGEGVLILSDLFGASPCNACKPYLKKGKVELVSGVNLPMVIKLFSMTQDFSLNDLANFIVDYGQRNILRGTNLV